MKLKQIVFTVLLGLCAVLTVAVPAQAEIIITTAVTGPVDGNADTTTPSGNTLTVTTGGVVTGQASGGSAMGSGDATNNILNITGTGNVTSMAIGGNSSFGNATGNAVNISGGSVHAIYGGYSNFIAGNATGNTVTISGGTVSGAVLGGYIGAVNGIGDMFTGNTLNLNSNTSLNTVQNFETINWAINNVDIGTIDTTVRGGADGALVKLNIPIEVFMNGTITGSGGIEKIGNGNLYLTGDNTYTGGTTITCGTLYIGDSGTTGSITGDIINNSYLIFNRSDAYTYDGNISGTGDLIKSHYGTLTLTGNNTYTGDTNVYDGTLAGNIAAGTNLYLDYGGTYDGTGAARSVGTLGGTTGTSVINTHGLTVSSASNSTFSGIISGAGGLIKDGTGTLTLAGGNAYTGATEVKGGTLTLTATGALASQHLILNNGVTFVRTSGSQLTNLSQLDVKGTAAWTGALDMTGKALNFYVPTSMAAGGSMLSVSSTANITGATVKVSVNGGTSALDVGDTIVLIASTGGLTSGYDATPTRVNGIAGIANIYEFDLTTDTHNLYATAAEVSDNPQTKALSEGQLGGLGFLNQGSDLISGSGTGSMMQAAGAAQGIAGFAAMGGGTAKYKTGSHVDVKGFSVMAGLAKNMSEATTAGAFVEAGWGNYDSFNSFNTAPSVDGSGSTNYYGLGFLGRYNISEAWYGEGSVRAGQTKTDFSGNFDIIGNVSYETSAMYAGAHIGAGYLQKLNEQFGLDLSAKLFYTYQGGDDVTIAGDKVEFDAASSMRTRLGGRVNYEVKKNLTPYAGAFLDYEFGGEAKAKVNGSGIESPELKGATGVGELGIGVIPSDSLPLALDIGVQGYAGTRQGFSGTLQVKFMF